MGVGVTTEERFHFSDQFLHFFIIKSLISKGAFKIGWALFLYDEFIIRFAIHLCLISDGIPNDIFVGDIGVHDFQELFDDVFGEIKFLALLHLKENLSLSIIEWRNDSLFVGRSQEKRLSSWIPLHFFILIYDVMELLLVIGFFTCNDPVYLILREPFIFGDGGILIIFWMVCIFELIKIDRMVNLVWRMGSDEGIF